MRSRPGDTHWIQEARSARELLGPGHPLARVDEDLDAVATRLLAVAALALAGVAARLDGVPTGLALAMAAGVVEALLLVRAAVLAQIRRDHALALLANGYGNLPLDAVARERRRLLNPNRRRHLARSFDELRDEALHPPAGYARVPRIYDRAVIAATASDLTKVARLLTAEGAGIRGVAMARMLLIEAGSPLYRSDLRLLREQLHCVEYHLTPGPRSAAPPHAARTRHARVAHTAQDEES